MNYCTKCLTSLGSDTLETNAKCPTCEGEILIINAQRLNDLFAELSQAVKGITSAENLNPMQVVSISKIIEKGERKLAKEYERRIDQFKKTQIEMSLIESFAAKMGYKLVDNL